MDRTPAVRSQDQCPGHYRGCSTKNGYHREPLLSLSGVYRRQSLSSLAHQGHFAKDLTPPAPIGGDYPRQFDSRRIPLESPPFLSIPGSETSKRTKSLAG